MAGSLTIDKPTPTQKLQDLVPNTLWHRAHWHDFVTQGLPTAKDEDWKYTAKALERFLKRDYAVPQSLRMRDGQLETLLEAYWQEESYKLVFINGRFSVRLSDWIPKVDVQCIEHRFDDLDFIHDSAVQSEVFAALTNATAQGGVTIDIPAKLEVDKPIHMIHYHSGYKGEVSSVRHHVTLGDLATCEIIEQHISLDHAEAVTLSRLTIDVGNGANVEHTKLVEEGPQQQHFGHNDIKLGRDANASSHTFMLTGQLIRHHTSGLLGHPGSHIEMNSLGIPGDDQKYDTRTYLRHQSAHCTSEQLHKMVGCQTGQGVFDGMIYVAEGALKTDGQMDNHNLLLSDHSRVDSRPKLEIYADDVKCSHGATTGQLDPDQIFYLQARGISKHEAEKIITHAFAAEVCDKVGHKGIRKFLHDRLNVQLEAIK